MTFPLLQQPPRPRNTEFEVRMIIMALPWRRSSRKADSKTALCCSPRSCFSGSPLTQSALDESSVVLIATDACSHLLLALISRLNSSQSKVTCADVSEDPLHLRHNPRSCCSLQGHQNPHSLLLYPLLLLCLLSYIPSLLALSYLRCPLEGAAPFLSWVWLVWVEACVFREKYLFKINVSFNDETGYLPFPETLAASIKFYSQLKSPVS